MFTKQQIESLDKEYFNILSAFAHIIVLQSRNTGHFWSITGTGYGDEVKIQHKHNKSSPWHDQAFYIKCRHNLEGAIKAIKKHDMYILEKGDT